MLTREQKDRQKYLSPRIHRLAVLIERRKVNAIYSTRGFPNKVMRFIGRIRTTRSALDR